MSINDIARLAAQLARTSAARHMTVDEIAADAIRIVTEAKRARAALERGQSMAAQVSKIAAGLDAYGARIVPSGDVAGMAIGLKFDDGSYRNGAGNVFHVA